MKADEQDLFYRKEGFAQECAALYPVILRAYNPQYPAWFAEEKDNLTA
ncbi:MAG: hypothetical protein LBM74_09590 [Oscillospiraceae bacterium]|jgi:hypothetical protein|nr:hypothetical protein [Oscillospiraceae bacterium]